MDSCICMGASVSALHGYNKARGAEGEKKSVAVIGDSTFAHSGITSLIDIAYNLSLIHIWGPSAPGEQGFSLSFHL